MNKHILLVFTNPRPGREGEFNAWYEAVHLPEVLQVAGFAAAQRFVARTGLRGEEPEHRHLAVYEVEAQDLPDAMSALKRAAASMDMSDALDGSDIVTYAFSAVGERQEFVRAEEAVDAES